jgi:hypothetical protein
MRAQIITVLKEELKNNEGKMEVKWMSRELRALINILSSNEKVIDRDLKKVLAEVKKTHKIK